ncbi:MAG: molybdate ABC transporter substrate-binding protein [Candidatus Hydrogenedentes bacterium]|nr:molybdate ABC transporter substrate-binding protein [Candidatus Hydrogenedentota bacterium]
MRFFRILYGASIAIVALSFSAGAVDPPAGTVYAAVASNFAEAQDALAKAFQAKTGHTIKVSPGSTGKLYAQVKNGGPFEIFLSADDTHVDKLITDKLALDATRFTYAVGRLALYAPSLKPVAEGTLKSTAIKHLSIANPEVAPYGVAATETLKKLGLLDAFKDRTVYGENIAQTLQFVDSGAAEAGFVAYSQVKKFDAGTFWLVPTDSHAPIKQDAILLSTGKDNAAAIAYLAFIRSEDGQKIIESFGYSVEKTSPPAR